MSGPIRGSVAHPYKTAPSNASGGGYGAHAGGQFAPDRAARSRDVRSQIEERNADEVRRCKL